MWNLYCLVPFTVTVTSSGGARMSLFLAGPYLEGCNPNYVFGNRRSKEYERQAIFYCDPLPYNIMISISFLF